MAQKLQSIDCPPPGVDELGVELTLSKETRETAERIGENISTAGKLIFGGLIISAILKIARYR